MSHSLNTEQDVNSEDTVPRVDHDTMREQLEGEVNHLTQLLQEALRKQDEMALEAADAWQKVGEKPPKTKQKQTYINEV